MVKMTAAIIVMSYPPTVLLAIQKLISSVLTTDVFLNNGCVILPMIVAMDQMKQKHAAQENIGTAQKVNSNVETVNVYLPGGDVITKMTAAMILMSRVA
uniref:Putative secreted protein n=1 Tax=Xenopsylla cheopis TaxID=163159 RepID=A0A6M2E1L2_XENCH